MMCSLGSKVLLILATTSLLLGSCGGGGGGSSPPPPASTSWSQQAYLKAPNAEAEDLFGFSVAASGDTVVVGAWREDSNQTVITNGDTASADNSAFWSGAAYVFVRNGNTWTQQAYLKASDATSYFGFSVAVSGDTIVVGALASNAAYVFVRNGSTWTQQAKLTASNADVGDQFGYSVAVSGDTVVVGANREASNQTTITNGDTASADNSAPVAGAAYVFVRNGTTWTQQAYLKAANAEEGDQFGYSVAATGDTVVVGANREASNQTAITNGDNASADNSAESAGAVYVFARNGTTWTQQAYLKAANAEASDMFGVSVAAAGDTVVVGAIGEDSNQTTITNGGTASADNTANGAGAAYVFVRNGTTWTQQAYLKASNAGAGDAFAASVTVSGDTVVVATIAEASNQTTIGSGDTASADNSASYAGAAYVFARNGTTWTQQAYLKASNAEAGDTFGTSVAASGDTVVVGAGHEASNQTTVTNGGSASADNSAPLAGAGYVFNRN